MMTAVIAFVVQIFYAWRIYRFSKSRLLLLVIIALAITQIGGGLAFGIELHKRRASISQVLQYRGPIAIWLVGNILADILIAAAMTILMLKNKTPYDTDTDRMMNKIIRLTVDSETGTATASMATLDLLLSQIYPDKAYFIFPALVMSKIYPNSLLTNLLSRAFITRDVHCPHRRGEQSSLIHLLSTLTSALSSNPRPVVWARALNASATVLNPSLRLASQDGATQQMSHVEQYGQGRTVQGIVYYQCSPLFDKNTVRSESHNCRMSQCLKCGYDLVQRPLAG